MAAFLKANDWVEVESESADLDGDQFMIALSNTAPGSETNPPLTDTKGILANVTQVSYTNLATSRNLVRVTSAQTAGVYKLDFDDLLVTAGAGGSVGPFRYVYVYDDTLVNKNIVGCYDLITPITIQASSSISLQFHANGFMNKT